MDLRNSQLDWHSDVLLGDFRGCSGASVTAVEMNDVSSRIVRADSDHVDIVRCADLHRKYCLGVHSLNPVKVLRVIFDRVGRVEWEWTE